jgi:hypothetical protein
MKIELIINPESNDLKVLESRLGAGVGKQGGAKRGGGAGG